MTGAVSGSGEGVDPGPCGLHQSDGDPVRRGLPVVVIGAGASGLLAAGNAAQEGARVLLLEKMERVGRKLRITGKGRCNLTNTAELPEFLAHFARGGPFLRPALFAFRPGQMIELLGRLGVPTVTERGGRVFPAGEKAQDVVRALEGWIRDLGVVCRTGSAVDSIIIREGAAAGVGLRDGSEVDAGAVVLAAGGASYPGTGSSGDSYRLAGSAGHTIVPIRPALVPMITGGTTAGRLEGLSLRNVTARLIADGRRVGEAFGEMVFTDRGVSGPIVLTLSRQAGDLLGRGSRVILSIDLKPALDEQKLDARILRDIGGQTRRQVRTFLQGLLPRRMIDVCLEETGVPPDLACSQITAGQRRRLRAWLKGLPLDVTGVGDLAEAIVTAGGVDRREVDPRTMQSRKVRNLFLAGEALDLDADTGGFNLQAAFSTGWLAGRSAARAVTAVDSGG